MKSVLPQRLRRQIQSNLRMGGRRWGPLSEFTKASLRRLTIDYGFSIENGDLLFLEGRWYVTNAGLLRLSQRRRCVGITALLQKDLSDPSLNRWIFKATVHRSGPSKAFVGYGDADPANVSSLMHGAEMRIAETRAVNRALRKAYGIGLCSVEELGSPFSNSRAHTEPTNSVKCTGNGHGSSQPRLRDQLCVLIRQHDLDPILVKAYAAEFCGTPSLKEASRDLVESFVKHLAASLHEDKTALIAKLNSYSQPKETRA